MSRSQQVIKVEFSTVLLSNWSFLHVYTLQVNLLFSHLILCSVFSDYTSFYRYFMQSSTLTAAACAAAEERRPGMTGAELEALRQRPIDAWFARQRTAGFDVDLPRLCRSPQSPLNEMSWLYGETSADVAAAGCNLDEGAWQVCSRCSWTVVVRCAASGRWRPDADPLTAVQSWRRRQVGVLWTVLQSRTPVQDTTTIEIRGGSVDRHRPPSTQPPPASCRYATSDVRGSVVWWQAGELNCRSSVFDVNSRRLLESSQPPSSSHCCQSDARWISSPFLLRHKTSALITISSYVAYVDQLYYVIKVFKLFTSRI